MTEYKTGRKGKGKEKGGNSLKGFCGEMLERAVRRDTGRLGENSTKGYSSRQHIPK